MNSEVNARRIANVEACFGSSGQPLAAYGRVLVGEGVLVKICRLFFSSIILNSLLVSFYRNYFYLAELK